MAASKRKLQDLSDLTPSERQKIQVKFNRQIDTLQKNEPKHEFLTAWSKVNGRKERNQIMAKWLANDYELDVEYFCTKAERFEDAKGLSGETFPREALVNMWGEERADTFINNCEALRYKFPELVSDDALLGCKVYMYSRTVVRALRSTLDSVTSQSHASSGSRDNGNARSALPPMPAEEVEDCLPAPAAAPEDGPPAPAAARQPAKRNLEEASITEEGEPSENMVAEKPKRPKVVKQFKRKLAEVFASMPPDCDWQEIIPEIMENKTNNTN
jgi:hypothetical protein